MLEALNPLIYLPFCLGMPAAANYLAMAVALFLSPPHCWESPFSRASSEKIPREQHVPTVCSIKLSIMGTACSLQS